MNSELQRQYEKYQVVEGFYKAPSKMEIYGKKFSVIFNSYYEKFRRIIIPVSITLFCLCVFTFLGFAVYKFHRTDEKLNVYLNYKSYPNNTDLSISLYDNLRGKKNNKDLDLGRFSKRIDKSKLILNADGTYDYNGDLNLELMQLKSLLELPIRLRDVNGTFNCIGNDLISLEGCPERIGYSFYCNGNDLITTQYWPESISAKIVIDADMLFKDTKEPNENNIKSFLRMNKKQQLKELEFLDKMNYASYEKMLELFNNLYLE